MSLGDKFRYKCKAVDEHLMDSLENALRFLGSERSRWLYRNHVRSFMEFYNSTPDEYVSKALQDPKAAEKDILSYIQHFSSVKTRRGTSFSGAYIGSSMAAVKCLLEYNDVEVGRINWKRLRKAMP